MLSTSSLRHGSDPGVGPAELCADGEPTSPRYARASMRGRLSYEYVDLEGLGRSAFEHLYEEMGEVMVDACASTGDRDWAIDYWSGREQKARSGTRGYLVRDGDELVGFMLFSSQDVGRWNCVLMQSGFVRPTYQRRGIGFALCARVVHREVWRRPWREFLWVAELINPVILHGWISRFPARTKMVPAVSGRGSGELDDLASTLAARFFPENRYEPEFSVLSGRTTPRPTVVEWSGDRRIDDYFAKHMNPITGDSILFVGQFDRVTMALGLGQLLGTTWRMLDRRLRGPRSAEVPVATVDP